MSEIFGCRQQKLSLADFSKRRISSFALHLSCLEKINKQTNQKKQKLRIKKDNNQDRSGDHGNRNEWILY